MHLAAGSLPGVQALFPGAGADSAPCLPLKSQTARLWLDDVIGVCSMVRTFFACGNISIHVSRLQLPALPGLCSSSLHSGIFLACS